MESTGPPASLPAAPPTAPTIATAQVKRPREFKFVGAFSRKRRQGRAPKPAGAATKPPAAPSRPVDVIQHPDVIGPEGNATDLTGMPTDAQQPVPTEISSTTIETIETREQPDMLSPPHDDPTAASVDNFAEMTDWTCGALMSPFNHITAGFDEPFDPFSYHYQLPFSPGAGSLFGQLGESSASDSPTRTHPGAGDEEPAVQEECRVQDMPGEPTGDEITLPPLDHQRPMANITHTISQLLTRYDQEFCVLPLTHDFEANPFRFDPKTGRGSQLLLHCILAISYKHISRGNGRYSREAKTHKKMAFQLLKDAEGNTLGSPLQANQLDALLILMTLDCATSARGPWTWYLQRAFKMIQATESLNVQKTPRIQARIDMLVWWDVTLALITRKGCVMSESTMLSLLNPTGTLADPNFYSVSGCSHELFSLMIRLASYAREYELASTMTYVKFDMDLISDAARKIKEWHNPRLNDYTENDPAAGGSDHGDTDPADVLQYREDIYHCAEAWRYALLLYIERVFKWRNQPASSLVRFLARRTLNHVLACRRTSMVQKQLLLPVFLAGCEVTDEYLQQQALLYCHWWNEQARYEMFLTAAGLLEEMWVKHDPREWWGSILDQKARESGTSSPPRQYLFG